MKNKLPALVILFSLLISNYAFSQCTVNALTDIAYICSGEPLFLSANGTCYTSSYIDDFNTGVLGPMWSSNVSPMFSNPCPPGVDTSTYLWIGPGSNFPRELVTNAISLSNNNCQISFDMKYAAQSISTPCEGPDLATEGVHLQYSNVGISGPWTDINYWNPNGGNDPTLIYWNHFTNSIAISSANNVAYFRWYQTNTSGNDYDHWGLDNVSITCGSYNSVSWSHGPTVLSPQLPVYPTTDTMFIVTITGDSGIAPASDTVFVFVDPTPNLYSITGGGSYPQGGSGVSVGLTDSDIGVEYTLVVNGNFTSNVLIGTGNSLDFGLQTIPGSYAISAESAPNGVCKLYMTGLAIVSIINNLEENIVKDFNIYPNPNNGIFTVEGENIELVSITDISGKVILEMEVKEDIIEVDLSTYPKAMYFVNVYTEDGVGVKKIVVK